MAKTVETGIVISADSKGLEKGVSKSKKVLKGLRRGLALSSKGIEGFGGAYKKTIDVVFKSLEVFKSVQGLISGVFGGLFNAGLELRQENDRQKRDWIAMQNEAKELKAMLGDFLLPVVLGIADAFKGTGKGFGAFIKGSKELIQTKIVLYIRELGIALARGVGRAAIEVNRIFNGLIMTVNTIKWAVAGFGKVYTDLITSFLKGSLAIHRLTGAEEKLIEQTKNAIKSNEELSRSFRDTGDNALAAAARAATGMEEFEKTALAIEKGIERGVNAVADAIDKRYKQAPRKRKANWREIAEAAAEAKRKQDKLDAERARLEGIAARKREALRAKELAEEQRAIEEKKRFHMQLGQVIGQAPITALQDMLAGTKSVGVALRDMVIQLGVAITKMVALRAIQKAVDAGTVGATGGGIASSLLPGLVGLIPTLVGGFNSGGYVKGYASGGGVDSVRAMLTPGEYVLPKKLVDNIRLGQAPARATYATGGLVGGSSSSVGTTEVNVRMQTFAVPSRAEFRRWYKSSVSPNVRKMAQRGQL